MNKYTTNYGLMLLQVKANTAPELLSDKEPTEQRGELIDVEAERAARIQAEVQSSE